MVVVTPGPEMKVDSMRRFERKRVTAKDCNDVGVKGQSSARKVLAKKRLDARTYRMSLFKPPTQKALESDNHEKQTGHDEVSQGDSEHKGACSSMVVESATKDIVRNEEVGETDVGEGSDGEAGGANPVVRELEGEASDDSEPNNGKKRKLHSGKEGVSVAERLHVDCPDGDDSVEVSRESTLEGKSVCVDRFLDKVYTVARSQIMRSRELYSDASVMAKNKQIHSFADPVTSSLSGSKGEHFLEHYDTCSKRRVKADSEKSNMCSRNYGRNHQLCNLSPEVSMSGYNEGDVRLMEKSTCIFASEQKSNSSKIVEYWVPVHLSNVQLEQYCATLLSNSSLLCSCSKNDLVEALQDILISARKSCDHPYLVDQSLQRLLIKDLPEVEYLKVGVNASAKLQVLEKTLEEIKLRGLRVVVLFQSIGGSGRNNIGDILDDFLRQKFGLDSYERVDSGLHPSKKQAALNMFNNKDSGRFVFLIENRACLPSVKLSSVDMAIIFGSDLNPLNDLRALQKITIESQFEQLKIFRLYSPFTVEEKILCLAKEDMILDSNVQNMSRRISHVLLLWGVHFLFHKLDEFHSGCILSCGSNVSSEQSYLNDVVQELLSQLPNNAKTNETRNCKLVSKAHQNGASYSKDIQLVGEKEMQPRDGELPHVLWTNILIGRYPRWRYASVASQRTRKRVQYESPENPKKDEIVKKRKKVANDTVYSNVPKSCLDSNRTLISTDKGGPSGTPTCNASQKNSANHDVSDQIEMHTAEPNEGRNLCDSQKKCPLSLKTGILKLYEILQLPDNVKNMAGEVLEYISNNHHVCVEPVTILQAFQLSLCWFAASLLRHKISHRESLSLAKHHLSFHCKDEEINAIYSKLQKLKPMFSQLAKSAGPICAENTSPRDKDTQQLHLKALQPTQSSLQELEEGEVRESSELKAGVVRESPKNCKGSIQVDFSEQNHTADSTENCSPKDEEKHQLHPREEKQEVQVSVSQTKSSSQHELEEGEIRDSPNSSKYSIQVDSYKHDYPADSDNSKGSSDNGPSRSVEQVETIHRERITVAKQKQMEEFEKSKKYWEKEKEDLEKEHKFESLFICKLLPQSSGRSEKLKMVDQQFARKKEELNIRMEKQQQILKDVQLRARNAENQVRAHCLEETNSRTQVTLSAKLPVFREENVEELEHVVIHDNSDFGSREEHMDDSEQGRVGQRKATMSSLSLEKQDSNITLSTAEEVPTENCPIAPVDLNEIVSTETPPCTMPLGDEEKSKVPEYGINMVDKEQSRLYGSDSSSPSLGHTLTGLRLDQEIGTPPNSEAPPPEVTIIEHIQSTAPASVLKDTEASSDEVLDLSRVENQMSRPTGALLSNPVNDESLSPVVQLQLPSAADPLAPEQSQPDVPICTRGDQEETNEPIPQFDAPIWQPVQAQDLVIDQSGDQSDRSTCLQAQVPVPSSDPPYSTEQIRLEAPASARSRLLENRFKHAVSQQTVVPSQPAGCPSTDPSRHGVPASTYTDCVQSNERPTYLQQFDAHRQSSLERNQLFNYSELISGNRVRDIAVQPSQVPVEPVAMVQTPLLNHSVLQTSSLSHLHLPMGSFMYGSRSHLSGPRSMNLNPEFSPRPPYIAPISSGSSSQLCPDPLLNECERLFREKEQTIKMLEDKKMRLYSEREKEMEEIRRKYNAMLQEIEMEFLQRKKTLERNYKMLCMHKKLAEAFRFNCDAPL